MTETADEERTAPSSSESTGSEAIPDEAKNQAIKKIVRAFSSIAQNLIQQVLFVASILAGFIFTIIFDLVLGPENVDNSLLFSVFAFLLVSGFSLLICITLGAIIQIVNNIENLAVIRSWNTGSIISLANDTVDMEAIFSALANFLLIGTITMIGAFLFGIMCFTISITLLGWLRSPEFGFLATLLMVSFGYLTYRIIKYILSEMQIDKLKNLLAE